MTSWPPSTLLYLLRGYLTPWGCTCLCQPPFVEMCSICRYQFLKRFVILPPISKKLMRLASKEPNSLKFWGRLSGGNRTTVVWVRVYIPISAFGDGWDAVALVVDGFGLCDAKASRPIGLRNVASTSTADCKSVGVVCSEDSGKVDVRPVEDKGFLFVLSSRDVAEELLQRRWTVEGCYLILERVCGFS
ncbi:hypothetical protein CsSME_00009862 [Camellia sinensis var. sinensis]